MQMRFPTGVRDIPEWLDMLVALKRAIATIAAKIVANMPP